MDIPIHAGYKFNLSPKTSMFVEAGPYFDLGLNNVFKDSEGESCKNRNFTISVAYTLHLQQRRAVVEVVQAAAGGAED